MHNPAGYLDPVKIYESSNSRVYRAFDERNNRNVIIKKLNKGYHSPGAISEFYREYELTGIFKNEGVIKIYEFSKIDNSPAIIMEDIEGISLADILKSEKIELNEFLDVALSVIEIIGNIHKHNIIHKDINPSNIIWNREKKIVRIIDFGIATELPREITSAKNPNILEGTIAYISPEQTGRMNRAIDYRTDFYSLGVTFYLMLTGRLPFNTGDMLKLVHSHIAVQPDYPHGIDNGIPVTLSEIVMKLMAKNAEDRYNSTYGISADIERCRKELKNTGNIRSFTLGEYDVSSKFQIPQKLYGREVEIGILMSAFERVSGAGIEFMIVSGFAGIGKSVLINEIQKPIVKHSGYFISGKFEKLKKDIPYSGIIQAFAGFARQILSENKSEITVWRMKLLNALGPNGKIVTDIIPMFELIIGKQPDVPALGPVETRNRFKLVFQRFIKVLACKEHPLALFLDDLQWADLASLNLLKFFTSDYDLKYIFIIGAYRDNETPDSHPLNIVITDIIKSGTAVNTIMLQPLGAEHVNEILGDTLNRSAGETRPLAELLLRKTAGNPFFINEFLNFLYKESCFEYSFNEGWSWRINDIEDMQVTDNVIDLMIRRITALPESFQEILKLGACMGGYFNLQTMLTVYGKPEKDLMIALNGILREGMINGIDDIYRFSHGRILEAAYSLISEEEKIKQHYRIGNMELEKTDAENLHDKIFYIVNHLNSGVELVTEKSGKLKLAGLNLSAGEKALMSNAYESSLNYFKAGIRLLDEDCWIQNYDLTLALYREGAIAAQLNADYDSMEKLGEEVYKNARSILDKINVYEASIFACIARNQLPEGVRLGLKVLRELGVKLPEKPGKVRTVYEIISLKFFLAGKSVDNLIDLPEMKDPHKLAIMQILTGIGSSAYYAAPSLLPIAVFNTVRFSVKYGNSIYSPYSYAAFGMIHSGVLGQINAGYKWGRLAMDLVEKLNTRESKSRVWFIVWFMINHWTRDLRETIKALHEGYLIGLETGDLEFASLSAVDYTVCLFFSGIELPEVEREMELYVEAGRKLNQDTTLTYQLIAHQTILNLMGRSENPCRLIGSSYNEIKMMPTHEKANDITAIFSIYYYLLNLNYLFENNKEAFINAQLVNLYIEDAVSSPYIPLFYFYDSLTRLALYAEEKKPVQKKYMKAVLRNQKRMKKWAFHAPMNFRNKYHLVEAEIARVSKQRDKAMKHYKLAAELAHENNFIQEEALAFKLTAKFWIELEEMKIAGLYMSEALHAYNVWGASALVKNIQEKYSSLLHQHTSGLTLHSKSSGGDTSSRSTSEFIDIATVIKTSQTLSSEIDLGRLLEATIKFSLENAGAQRGFLIMKNNDKNLYIEAQGESDREVKTLGSISVENNPDLSSAIINYVNITGENVVLDNACKDGNFTEDSYIIENQVKSVLCTPITYKGRTSGILYLENNLTANVFTPERIELLRILSAQAAISVENARLLMLRENKAKLEKEIEMAEGIQRSLLPENVPEIRDVRVAFKYIPMMGVGGDFVNIYYREDDNKIGLFICDVSGHGVYAAMIASMVSNALDFFWESHFDNPSEILKKMSNFLKGKMGGNFFTGCICSIDISSGLLTMANAGHPPLMLISKDKTIEMKRTKGRLINEFFEPNQENISFSLCDGDTIVLYTDGITEAENQNGDVVGGDDEKFSRWIRKFYEISDSPDELCKNIYAGVVDHTGTDQLADDFTILVLEYKG